MCTLFGAEIFVRGFWSYFAFLNYLNRARIIWEEEDHVLTSLSKPFKKWYNIAQFTLYKVCFLGAQSECVDVNIAVFIELLSLIQKLFQLLEPRCHLLNQKRVAGFQIDLHVEA